jgi:hypothetical protein
MSFRTKFYRQSNIVHVSERKKMKKIISKKPFCFWVENKTNKDSFQNKHKNDSQLFKWNIFEMSKSECRISYEVITNGGHTIFFVTYQRSK